MTQQQPHHTLGRTQGTDLKLLVLTVATVVIAAAALLVSVIFTVSTLDDKRNAALVQIGVGVLRVDPAKNPQMAAAREWAINLIDANAGGIKFSAEARAELLQKPLGYDDSSFSDGNDGSYDDGANDGSYVSAPTVPKK
ncbi:MAG: hypothetical protein WA280_18315 [Xanthobacteraceae bacterium]